MFCCVFCCASVVESVPVTFARTLGAKTTLKAFSVFVVPQQCEQTRQEPIPLPSHQQTKKQNSDSPSRTSLCHKLNMTMLLAQVQNNSESIPPSSHLWGAKTTLRAFSVQDLARSPKTLRALSVFLLSPTVPVGVGRPFCNGASSIVSTLLRIWFVARQLVEITL